MSQLDNLQSSPHQWSSAICYPIYVMLVVHFAVQDSLAISVLKEAINVGVGVLEWIEERFEEGLLDWEEGCGRPKHEHGVDKFARRVEVDGSVGVTSTSLASSTSSIRRLPFWSNLWYGHIRHHVCARLLMVGMVWYGTVFKTSNIYCTIYLQHLRI